MILMRSDVAEVSSLDTFRIEVGSSRVHTVFDLDGSGVPATTMNVESYWHDLFHTLGDVDSHPLTIGHGFVICTPICQLVSLYLKGKSPTSLDVLIGPDILRDARECCVEGRSSLVNGHRLQG